MPIYEYACTECGHHIEIIQKVDARAPGRCEKCSGRLKKLVSRTSFLLKGGGWYADGYGDTASAKSTSSASEKSKSKKGSGKSKKAASA